MDRTSDFLVEFQNELDAVPLPEAVAGTYRLESCLSSGVWLVRSRSDNRPLVLRVSREEDLREEFAAIRRLPEDLEGRVPRAVDFFEEGGAQYLLRTYLPGRSLAEVWEAEAHSEREVAALGRELCALLDRLHRLSPPVIHRDIKPENILLSPEGLPCLIDFGIARSYDPDRNTDTVCMGTRSTAAPEQYGFSQSDQRTDLYALAVTLRWMMTGSYRPEALEMADCSQGMKRFLRKAASFAPADRYPDARSMGAALVRLAAPPRRRILPVLLACLAAVLVAAGGWFLHQNRPVDFGSPLLEQAVRLELDRPGGRITRADLEQVRRLAVVGREMVDEGRQFRYRLCAYVDDIPQNDAPRGDICDLSLLSEIPNLTTLSLCRQEITDITPLSGLPLRALYLADNHIADLAPLETLPELEVLYIGSNPARELSPIAALERLRELNLDAWTLHEPESLSPLVGLPVECLSLGNLSPLDGDWSVLGKLEALGELWLWDPPGAALEALSDCGGVYGLNLGNCREQDLTVLPAMPWLESLSLFNRLPSIEGVEKQTGLNYLNLCNMEGVDLSPAASLEGLREMNFFNVQVRSYAPLLEAEALERVNVDTEAVRAAVEADCPGRSFEIRIS